MSRALVAAALAAVAALGCAPSVDPAARADVDRRLAALPRSDQAFPSPRSFLPMPLMVGQWTEHRYRDDDGQPVLVTHKLVGEENGAHWVETVTARYSGREVVKMLVGGLSARDPSRMEVRAVKTKDARGHVVEVDPNLLAVTQATYRELLAILVLSWEGQPQEDVAVGAGSFAGCYRARTDAPWGPWRAASLVWSHPAVPLSGLVRGQRLDKPALIELVAFGETGAQTELD